MSIVWQTWTTRSSWNSSDVTKRTGTKPKSTRMRRLVKGPRLDMDQGSDVAPPRAQAAIDLYLRDVGDRRSPGFHPMTYYMSALGYQAVIHADWGEFNSGDIGNIWYPQSDRYHNAGLSRR